MNTRNKVVVEVDIMRGEHHYATFRRPCLLKENLFTGKLDIDRCELLEAMYEKYPSVRGNNKFNIIINDFTK